MPLRLLTLSALLLLVAGCVNSESTRSGWSAEMPYPPEREPQIGDILHVATGHFVTEAQMLTNVSRQTVVYVGETHDNPASHRLELAVLKAMVAANPGRVALGMEMFTRDKQPLLDLWVAGELDEKAFLRESRWYSDDGWRIDFDHYRELLHFARDNRLPLVALNADKALARSVSMTPLDELSAEVRDQLPEMDMRDPYQRTMIETIFGAHGDSGGKMVESFFRRQTLWDETMAESVADYLKGNAGQQMVVIAGGWHVEHGFGIPRRVFRRLPVPYTIIGGHNLTIAESKRDQMMDVTLEPFPMRAVDYQVYQAYEAFEPRGVKLGVLLGHKDQEPGVVVVEVVPASNAEAAGIVKGERLLAIDGERLNDSFDVVYAVKQRRVGDKVSIRLKGEGGERTIEVTFKAGVKPHGK